MADPENTLVLETTKGRVVIALRPDLAPGHVERIKTLARKGFYDGVAFHRVIEGFMAQTGCPQGTGTGGSDLPYTVYGLGGHLTTTFIFLFLSIFGPMIADALQAQLQAWRARQLSRWPGWRHRKRP